MGHRRKLGAKTRENLLTAEELMRILGATKDLVERFLISCLAFTGLRVSELVHLRRDWIDFNSWFVRIPPHQHCDAHYSCRKRVVRRGRVIKPSRMWRPKNPDSIRTIPIVPELRGIFSEFFQRYGGVGEVCLGREYVWRMVKDVVRRAGVEKRIFPHVFRGTFATMLASKGFDAFAIQGFMGWRSIKTADEYVRISPERLKQMVEEKWEK